MLSTSSEIGVIGSGAMGLGIAQTASAAGHKVRLYDNNADALLKAKNNLQSGLSKLVEKQKLSEASAKTLFENITFENDLSKFKNCDLIIEAIVENLQIKKSVFQELEKIVNAECVLASNTSSLSITSISSACKQAGRVIGIHFFNPATLMPLVEIIPGLATEKHVIDSSRKLIDGWKKVTVLAKDTPGFIVNRVARPYYSEALRIYEEGIADMASIDHAMRNLGGFKMGPFELMDMIGHDVNYIVTETVWTQFYFDPKFKPSISQKRLLEGGFLGRKSGKGFYEYSKEFTLPPSTADEETSKLIFMRILCMLINEAADTLYLKIAGREDIDLAMTKGVNYPKGLLKWADEIGIEKVVRELNTLKEFYEEDRYRISPILKQMLVSNKRFWG